MSSLGHTWGSTGSIIRQTSYEANAFAVLTNQSASRLDKCYVTGYSLFVRIRNFVHKGLRKLYSEDAGKGLPTDAVDKLRKMLAFLDDMEDPEELHSLPAWKPHLLTGNRKGVWSLHVTRNWRLTFRIDSAEGEIYDVGFEDYH